ncbi:hypothetical protein [Allokutzneria sp. NRRL B-24872]|uniref:hypothetical protein n=1 Tax=Allokutzneria sp. NRRL B-24872 TaxID=1137961 RepID=UPI001FEF5EE0|nr:hypothetical protein [Allokutzneria sp. NRRL B-24872]
MRLMTSLAAAVLLIAGAVTPATAAAAELTQISRTPYKLAEGGSFARYAPRVAALDGKLRRASFADVLADGNRKARPLCRPTGISGASGFCWQNDGDTTDKQWYPQGITGSWDSSASGSYGGHKAMLVSWHSDNAPKPKGVRISFVNYDDPAKVSYRHVLLVEPTSDDTFGPVKVHAGGIAWVGDFLYVADTKRGFRVFDLRHLWRTEADPGKSKIGKGADGKYYAYDYRYVLPQVGSYGQSGNGSCSVSPPVTAPLCFSFVGLDRSTTTPSLIAGEYYYDGKGGSRLTRWNLNADNKLAEETAAGAYRSSHPKIQGALAYKDTFMLSSSRTSTTAGVLYRSKVGAASSTSHLPAGPEDLSYQASAKRLWALTEHPGNRQVIGIPITLG